MSFRYMRIILFFDLPAVTSSDHKAYRQFIKNLKKDGFFCLQESVYVKLAINQQAVNSIISSVKSYLPQVGSVMTLAVTEKQFSNVEIMLGESTTDVVNSYARIVKL